MVAYAQVEPGMIQFDQGAESRAGTELKTQGVVLRVIRDAKLLLNQSKFPLKIWKTFGLVCLCR